MKTIYAHCEKFRKRQKVKNILKITCRDTTKNATKFYLVEVKKKSPIILLPRVNQHRAINGGYH